MLDLLVMSSPVAAILVSRRTRLNLDLAARILLGLFIASSFCITSSYLLYGKGSGLLGLAGGYYMPLAFAFTVLQLYNSLKLRKAVVFIAVTWTFGLVSEWLGASYGLFFGHYNYNLTPFYFDSVPMMTPFSWVIIIYFSFGITNLMCNCMGSCAISLKRLPIVAFFVVVPAILATIDATVAMNLDLLLDPVSVDPAVAGWTWIGGGPFFGVPISNFIGWFLVTFLAMWLFRIYLNAGSPSRSLSPSADFRASLMYAAYLLIHSGLAIGIGRGELVLIGVGAMGPFLLLSLLCWMRMMGGAEREGGSIR